MKMLWCGLGVLALITIIGFFTLGGSIAIVNEGSDDLVQEDVGYDEIEVRRDRSHYFGRRNRLLRALDQDQDGDLSPEELDDAENALLSLDKNEDGALSEDELRPNFTAFGKRKE